MLRVFQKTQRARVWRPSAAQTRTGLGVLAGLTGVALVAALAAMHQKQRVLEGALTDALKGNAVSAANLELQILEMRELVDDQEAAHDLLKAQFDGAVRALAGSINGTHSHVTNMVAALSAIVPGTQGAATPELQVQAVRVRFAAMDAAVRALDAQVQGHDRRLSEPDVHARFAGMEARVNIIEDIADTPFADSDEQTRAIDALLANMDDYRDMPAPSSADRPGGRLEAIVAELYDEIRALSADIRLIGSADEATRASAGAAQAALAKLDRRIEAVNAKNVELESRTYDVDGKLDALDRDTKAGLAISASKHNELAAMSKNGLILSARFMAKVRDEVKTALDAADTRVATLAASIEAQLAALSNAIGEKDAHAVQMYSAIKEALNDVQGHMGAAAVPGLSNHTSVIPGGMEEMSDFEPLGGVIAFGAGGSERGVLAALASAVPFLRPSTQLEILKLLLSRRRKQRPYV
jgi:hypothetical protein